MRTPRSVAAAATAATSVIKNTSAIYKAEPVWACDGSLQLRYINLAVGQNVPIVTDCKYSSCSTFDSAVGYGWTLVHDRRLFEYSDGSIVVRTGCRHRGKFPSFCSLLPPRMKILNRLSACP